MSGLRFVFSVSLTVMAEQTVLTIFETIFTILLSKMKNFLSIQKRQSLLGSKNVNAVSYSLLN